VSHSEPGGGEGAAADSILVLGVGNLLLGDEGVGVHAVRELERGPLPAGVRVVDGGTGGFTLLSLLQEHPTVIFVDATLDGGAPGTVARLEPRFASDFPRVLSAHDIGLRDLVESAALLGPLPKMYLFTVSIAAVQPMSLELSPAVRSAVPGVAAAVRALVLQLAADPTAR
jgi:hydrogenase maturation protease